MRGYNKDFNTVSTHRVRTDSHDTAQSTESIPVELDRLVDTHHPLVLLAEEIDWAAFERSLLAPIEQTCTEARLALPIG